VSFKGAKVNQNAPKMQSIAPNIEALNRDF